MIKPPRLLTSLGCALALAALTPHVCAQSDNFDSGTLDPAWKQLNFNPALVQTSFVPVGTGKGLRIQANPVPNQAPALALFYRDNNYTNFFMAFDLAAFPGVGKNQAVVLLARATIGSDPTQVKGIICNYDPAQYGENATDRRQGQFQINMVNPGFGTRTLAAAEITLDPTRPYRITFKGEGSLYTASIYDFEDFTRPLVTVIADDVAQAAGAFTPSASGKSGILAFSRQGTAGTADFTVDNYYVGETDANTEAAPALSHPVVGTPVVVSRNLTNRFQNFFNPTNGLSFTIKSHTTTDIISGAATKIRLNGIDFSRRLVVSADDTNVTASLPGSALSSNKIYNVSIEVQDTTGAKKSTNTFWFDTLSDAYIDSAAVKTIEAEDYNYGAGQFRQEPIRVSGINTNGVFIDSGESGYFTLRGVSDANEANAIDYFDRDPTPNEYRNDGSANDRVGVTAGMTPELIDLNHTTATADRYADYPREKYATNGLIELVVNRTQPGEWMNYTRTFTSNRYKAYLRVASFGATTVELRKVTSSASTTNQATSKLGNFNVPNLLARYNYSYVPLVDDHGAPVTLDLSGTNTLRLQMAGVAGQDDRKLAINYMMFVPEPAPVTDNFDAGPLSSAWRKSNFNSALVQESFENLGHGRSFRVRANPAPPQAPAAAMYYRDEIFSDFYMALDLVNWPGTDKNQAVVLVARGNLSANPATTTGIILNYDASQYGENATDRRQGQFQINMVTNSPAFGTKTLAVAEITLQPGRPYRFVFQGLGSHYIGQIFDHEDLTTPLITIHADDVVQGPLGSGIPFGSGGFQSGKCGFLLFSRQGVTGTVDANIDNFYVAASNPNATGEGIQHPVAGTPIVVSRNPSARFKNLHNPTNGLGFTAKTFSTNQINAAATKLRLNGADVSSSLVLSTNASTVTGTLPGSALTSNTVYNAAIELQDVSGTLRSTNTFWFDTYSNAYLDTPPVKTIEAEDYNFGGGQYISEPIPVSGLNTRGEPVRPGEGYFGFGGQGSNVEATSIDFYDRASTLNEYRGSGTTDPVGVTAGMFPELTDLDHSTTTADRYSDNIRAKYAAESMLELVVNRTEVGEWMNYTRNFSNGTYRAYLRVASFGATDVDLRKVTSSASAAGQTTEKLGTFKVPNMITRFNYRYIPLTDTNGAPVTLNITNGFQTLRLQMAGVEGQDQRKLAINYILFEPFTAPAIQVLSSATVEGVFSVDAAATIDTNAKRITIPTASGNRFYLLRGAAVTLGSPQVSANGVVINYQ